jgi:hypothetical protein
MAPIGDDGDRLVYAEYVMFPEGKP